MRNIGYVVAATLLATASLVACSGDPAAPETPEPPRPATAVPLPDPAPSSSADVESTVASPLSPDCPPDGTLTDAGAVASCSALAMQQVASFSFSGEIDLLAFFAGEAVVAADASMRLSGTVVQPDRLRFTVALGPDEERIAIHGVTVGDDTYVQDPESGQWFQGTPPDSDVLAALQVVGLLLVPNDPGASLRGPVDLADGSRAYVLVSDEPGQESGTELPLGSGGRVTRTVGVSDFLTTEVRVAAQGLDGEPRDFLTISYQGYDETFAIEPPAEYLPLPDAVLESGTLGAPRVEGLTRNGAGDLAQLDALTVRAEQPRTGYDRSLFRHWVDADGDGCDTRREVLIAEAVTAPTIGAGCALSGGRWRSVYDNATDTGSGRGFDVDHLVPLAEAWESGAWAWSRDDRERYANDLGDDHALVAVSARSNRAKGARDPAEWLPPEESAHCWYAAAWITVKVRWDLTVDSAEADTLRRLIAGCDGDAGGPAPADPPAAEPPPESMRCHPAYDPCLPDLPGDALNCGDLTQAQKPVRVRVIAVDPYRLDSDHDGRGCTS